MLTPSTDRRHTSTQSYPEVSQSHILYSKEIASIINVGFLLFGVLLASGVCISVYWFRKLWKKRNNSIDPFTSAHFNNAANRVSLRSSWDTAPTNSAPSVPRSVQNHQSFPASSIPRTSRESIISYYTLTYLIDDESYESPHRNCPSPDYISMVKNLTITNCFTIDGFHY